MFCSKTNLLFKIWYLKRTLIILIFILSVSLDKLLISLFESLLATIIHKVEFLEIFYIHIFLEIIHFLEISTFIYAIKRSKILCGRVTNNLFSLIFLTFIMIALYSKNKKTISIDHSLIFSFIFIHICNIPKYLPYTTT